MTRPVNTPIVLVHGVGLDHTMWLSVMAALPRRRTITYDLIGHGTSVKPAGPYSLNTFVDQASTLVEAIDGEVDVVGFSMGALIAEGLALSPHGARLRRLVLLNAVHDRGDVERQAIIERVADVRAGRFPETVEPALQRWFTPGFSAARPDIVERIRRRLLDNDVRAYADAYEVFATADAHLCAGVRDITVPTLVVTGSDDQRSTPEMAVALAAALPTARAVILPGLRHLAPVEAPDLVARLIDEFTAP